MSDTQAIKQQIHSHVITLAADLGLTDVTLSFEDIIPEVGILDSISIIKLLAWFETTFKLKLKQSEVTIDNFGSINAMTNYYLRHKNDKY